MIRVLPRTAIALVLCLSVSAGAVRADAQGAPLVLSTQVPGPVPTQYQAEYDALEAEVGSFAARVGAAPKHPTAKFGIELLAANGNIGAGLLAPDAIIGVERELDAFVALGIQGVTVDVSFPLLLSSTPDSVAYLAFYEQVATQIRRRHLIFSVEENPIFVGTPLTSLHISYAGLTLSSYAAEAHSEAQVIIDYAASGLSVGPHRTRHLHRHPSHWPRHAGHRGGAGAKGALWAAPTPHLGRGGHGHLERPGHRQGAGRTRPRSTTSTSTSTLRPERGRATWPPTSRRQRRLVCPW